MFQQFGNVATYCESFTTWEVDKLSFLVTSTRDCAFWDLFNLNVLDQDVAEPVQPPEGLTLANSDGGQGHTQVHAVNEITVAADGASADNLIDLPSL